MNREENLFLAKKLFVELVYNAAYIEGCNVTFPQTQTILDGAVVNNVAVSDIQTVLNLRDGWKFVLSHIDDELDLDFICKVNEYVSRNESLDWGALRTGSVGISGTDFKPAVPVRETVISDLDKLKQIADPVDLALRLFCYAVRNQLFWDGNKRTATMVANKVLIQCGKGIMSIDSKNASDFNQSLLHYYDTDDNLPLLACLKNCIKTMERSISRESAMNKHDKEEMER